MLVVMTMILSLGLSSSGRSFNRLVARVIRYPATSVVVIRTEEGQVFGACVGR